MSVKTYILAVKFEYEQRKETIVFTCVKAGLEEALPSKWSFGLLETCLTPSYEYSPGAHDLGLVICHFGLHAFCNYVNAATQSPRNLLGKELGLLLK